MERRTRELGSVPTASLPQRLHAFFSDAVCEVFNEFKDPNTPPEESALQQRLVEPLQWLLCGGDPQVVFAGIAEHSIPSNFCGKVFKSGEPAYFCKDCQTDPTCCLCMECFERSEHKNHRYRLFASGGGGCCDCGDPEAWTSNVYCELHMPNEQNEEETDPVESLQPELASRARVFFSALLWYCMDVLCWTESNDLPPGLKQGKTAKSLANQDTYLTFLYNDEVHSYDEVIYTLTHNVKLTHTEAVALATYVDRKGRAVAKCGSENECLETQQLINTDLTSSIPLTVKVFHTTVAAHQSNAIITLSLLKDLAEKSAAFRRLISVVLVEESSRANACVMDRFFLEDSHLWIAARVGWHRLVMGSIFLDSVYKKDFAINLAKNYCQLQKNFMADSHHHDVCASNMTVQLFTVPSLSRMLVAEHGLLEKIIATLLELLSVSKDQASGKLKLRSDTYKHSRIVYIMYDLRYILRNKPETWSEQLRVQVIVAFNLLLDLLGMLQNVDMMRRQRGFHVEREEPWEHSFNFSIVLQPALLLFIEWCTSDPVLLHAAVKAAMTKHEEVAEKTKLLYKEHSVDRSLVGRKTVELIVFDILREHVSIHQPLPRIIAALLTGASAHNVPLTSLLQISPQDTRTPLFLMEHCSRAIVMAVQVLAGMWKRNGYSVVNQVINYQFYYSREVMYDKDIVMLQAMAAVLEPNAFMYALIYKFRLEKWLTCPDDDPTKRGETSEDALRFFISEAEEFIFLLIIVFSERYCRGVGEGVTAIDALRREIIHRLYISPLSHSELLKQFRMSENENEIDRLLKEVAILRRAVGGGKSVFELKAEYEKEYNPFFYHYTRMDHSKAEDAHRKKVKTAVAAGTRIPPAAPKCPPPFCEPFRGVMRLTSSPVLHRVLHCVLKQASSAESSFWSDKLLHEILHLCALLLSEETPTDPHSLCSAAIGRFGDNAFLEHLESLLTNRRAEEHRPLLSWIVQYLRGVRDHGTGGTPVVEVPAPMEVEGSPDVNATQRKEKAQERRDRLMAQMLSMQRKFLEDHREEIDDANSPGVDEPDSNAASELPPPRCAVGVSPLLGHTPNPVAVTCILCQEETKDFASQERTFVQAVHVQRSSVLRRCQTPDSSREVDLLSARADLPRGTYTSGCGHHMHADCWTSFIDNKRQEHGRRHFFPIPGQSVQWQRGEFLCPLCQCYGNTVLPLLPPVKVPSQATPPCREVGMAEWRDMVAMALELAESPEEEAMEPGTSVDPTFLDKLKDLFKSYRKPSCHFTQRETAGEKQASAFTGHFSQAVYMRAYNTDPDDTSDKVCVAEWNNCAYTIASLEFNARAQGKFLLEKDALSSRQRESISSLVRLGCHVKVRPKLQALAKFLRDLTNSFLLQTSPFTELPCILETDCFTMMVNLHFTLTSLFASLSGATGTLDENPVMAPLMGLTDECIVRICTAAQLLQYLLTCSPVMETNGAPQAQRADSGPEHGVGQALQTLWVKYRKIAQLPSDTPPSPYELYAGMQEHLYPFLQCSALFFHSLTSIDFVHSSASLASRFEDLCSYLSLPPAINSLFQPPPTKCIIDSLAQHWCSHPRLVKLATGPTPAPVLVSPCQLISLPNDFSELVKKASAFQCPKQLVDRQYGGDDGQQAMMCLVCGEMLCTNSYCCQHSMGEGENAVRIGGFTHHVQNCGVGMGMALWVLEAYVVLLDATDVNHVKGCTMTPPYLDEYGESDPGLRRGNPLKLTEDRYRELQQIWFQHRIPEQICKETESNRGLMRINWSRM